MHSIRVPKVEITKTKPLKLNPKFINIFMIPLVHWFWSRIKNRDNLLKKTKRSRLPNKDLDLVYLIKSLHVKSVH